MLHGVIVFQKQTFFGGSPILFTTKLNNICFPSSGSFSKEHAVLKQLILVKNPMTLFHFELVLDQDIEL